MYLEPARGKTETAAYFISFDGRAFSVECQEDVNVDANKADATGVRQVQL
jgi:hypothetical protein